MITEQIKGLRDQREVKVKALEEMLTKSEEAGRALSDEENDKFDETKSEISDIDTRIKRLEETEQLTAVAKAKPIDTRPTRSPAIQVTKATDDPSLFYAKQAHALFVNGNDRRAAADYAKEIWGDEVLHKVLRTPTKILERAVTAPGTSTTVGWAAELVQVNQAASAFIDALRAASVVARFPGMQMSFGGNGSISIPRKTGTSQGAWVGENNGIKVDALAFDNVVLTPKKNANIVVATNELLIRSDPSALMIIRDDIILGVAENIDSKFVSADAEAAGVSPAGLQTYDSAAATSTGATLDAITADLKAMVNQLLALNMPMSRPLWLINPVNTNALRFIRDGLGTYAFKTEIAGGTIVGYPYLESTTVPADIVMLVDASQVILATELAPVISISEDASLHMEDTDPAEDIGGATTPVASMFQLDSTAIRCKTTQDWGVRHADSVAVLDTVAWNA